MSGGTPAAGAGRPGLPTGTATFFFSDIEGSTRLAETLGAGWPEVLDDHHRLLREVFAAHGGVEVDSQGDAFFVAFPTAAGAVAAAMAAQLAVAAHAWPAPVRVRVGLHSADAQVGPSGYVGVGVHRGARVCGAGHGGQVLVSAATATLARSALPEAASLADLGPHRLKDLSEPEHLYQLCHPDLGRDFPPPRTLEASPHNLPVSLTSFVGREMELAEVTKLLPTTRLLTLVGAGGCGKTRLALQAAATDVEDHPDGAWLVELAPLADPALVPSAVATALGLREEPGTTLTRTIINHLSAKDLLLVVDNCEHLVDAAAELTVALLQAAPALSVLATSREPLGVPGEVTWPVPSLSTPGDAALFPETLLAFDAVALFVDRAQAASPAFALTPANAAAVAEICSRLDGIPLALELAAARSRALTPAEIAARLDHRFRLLTSGARTLSGRQQTLEAAVAWSHDLLVDTERTCFRRLAVFAGGCTLDAAEAVCAHDTLDASEVIDLVTALVDKSLLVAETTGDTTRYRMLETIREYATARLDDTDETEATRDRHLGFFTALAEAAEPELAGADQAEWLGHLEAVHDNLRAALAWATAKRPGEPALALAGALGRFWFVRGYWHEGRQMLERALAGSGAPSPRRALALKALGTLGWVQDDYPEARSLYEEALALYRQLGDRVGMANCLGNLGNVAWAQGDYPRARSLYEEALALYRQLGDRMGMANAVNNLGNVAWAQADYPRARSLLEEALAQGSDLGGQLRVANCLSSLGDVAWAQGDYAAAHSLLGDALALYRQLEHGVGVANCLNNLAHVAWSQGDHAGARSLYVEALALHRELGNKGGCASCLEGVGRLAAAQGRHRRGARLAGAAEVLREAISAGLPAPERARRDEGLAELHAALGEDALRAGLAEGRSMPIDEALDYAVSNDD